MPWIERQWAAHTVVLTQWSAIPSSSPGRFYGGGEEASLEGRGSSVQREETSVEGGGSTVEGE